MNYITMCLYLMKNQQKQSNFYFISIWFYKLPLIFCSFSICCFLLWLSIARVLKMYRFTRWRHHTSQSVLCGAICASPRHDHARRDHRALVRRRALTLHTHRLRHAQAQACARHHAQLRVQRGLRRLVAVGRGRPRRAAAAAASV